MPALLFLMSANTRLNLVVVGYPHGQGMGIEIKEGTVLNINI
jgi:hypothetical protein